MSVSIKPLEDRIVIKSLEAEQTTASGLVIPDTAKEKPQEGEVLAVGPGRIDDKGNRVPLDVQVGDDGAEALPEFLAGHAGVGQDFVLDESMQLGVDLQAENGSARCHGLLQGLKKRDQKKARAPRRLVPVRVGWVPSSSKGRPQRFTQSVR